MCPSRVHTAETRPGSAGRPAPVRRPECHRVSVPSRRPAASSAARSAGGRMAGLRLRLCLTRESGREPPSLSVGLGPCAAAAAAAGASAPPAADSPRDPRRRSGSGAASGRPTRRRLKFGCRSLRRLRTGAQLELGSETERLVTVPAGPGPGAVGPSRHVSRFLVPPDDIYTRRF
jgi:hypothetical protein